MLVEIFDPREKEAGEQKEQAQLCPGVSQQIDRNGVIEQHRHPGHQGKEDQKGRQTAPQHRAHGAFVSPRGILGGEVGHGHSQADRSDGEYHGIDRQDELIESHDLGAHQTGEKNAVDKSQHLGHQTGAGEQQGAV